MTAPEDVKPIVVGVDGSAASVEAAQWAVDEAIHRDVPLRLVSVTNILRERVPEAARCLEFEYAETALRQASAAIAATGKPVKIETEVLWGPPANALVAESRHATMVCVASVGIGVIARAILGSTAAGVAERAHCTVAVLRPSTDAFAAAGNWIAVGIDGSDTGDTTVPVAMWEARLRRAPLVVVGLGCNAYGVNTAERTHNRTQAWAGENPDIEIDTETATFGLADFLADQHVELSRRHPASNGGSDRPLAVIGSDEVTLLSPLIGPHDAGVREHARCSVIVVR
ncbi:universal stress protein [Mycolicibacterium lacusdiani]|uniref:universal stress protein n=1 Tax=Mycolicibacterium lacusdiani TaxID=2895283 RepID=UPI001F2A96CD|nr:universal stress protein [Mycolicibacterium lacusdiani]